MNIIEPESLMNMYSKGYFPMARNAKSLQINFYKPYKRFLIPIDYFHIPKKLFREFKKKKN